MSPIYILHLHLATFCIVHKICERDIIPSKQSTFEFISIPLTPCVWRTWTTQCCGGSRSGSTCGFPAPRIVVALFSSCSGSSTTNSARERFHVVQSQQSTKIRMNEDRQMHQKHTSVYKNCSTSSAPKILKYQNTNSNYSLYRYAQNIEVPHCADAPDRAAHQRLLRLGPRCLGQRRRLWSYKVFFFDCLVFVFPCLDLFRSSSGFVMKFASTILHWNTISPQGAEDRRGEVLGPCQLEKDQHERLPRGDEADKKVSRSSFTKNLHWSPLRSVSPDSLVPYEAWNQKFGEGAA